MLLPSDDGYFGCEYDDFKTSNLFEYMEHHKLSFDWMVRLSPSYSLNLFTFLEEMCFFMEDENYDEVWNHVQSVVLLLINSCGDDFEKFVQEAELVSGTKDMFDQLDKFLRNNEEL